MNITSKELNGDWDYVCEMMMPKTFFPQEFINNNENIIANRHGGTVKFHMFQNDNIEVNGQREWRDVKEMVKSSDYNTNYYKKLSKPKKWKSLYSLVFTDMQLLYQYKVDDNIGVNGISNVHLIKDVEKGVVTMTGWFYYVPSRNFLDKLRGSKMFEATKEQKAHLNEWLNLFGKVILTKKN